ncbi:hypothetical protein LEP1GSC106_0793 [Leptospira interrogans serovar Grippotyphosa str. UI 12764]|nr:hypothetical protein LEP1GSC106_0793 [Leptospira interrogans serovar Grippotyphosa str. UI 12764]
MLSWKVLKLSQTIFCQKFIKTNRCQKWSGRVTGNGCSELHNKTPAPIVYTSIM